MKSRGLILTKKSFQAIWLAALTFLAGCANVGATASAPASGANPQNTAEYVIGPGDGLDIFVWHNPDLTRTMPVRPDGRIAMPLVGDIVAVGKTPAALASEVQDKLMPYIRDPLVTVIPTQFVGLFTKQIRVIGEASQPKALPFRSAMTALDVLIEVGGLTKFADGDRAVLVRQVNGKQESYRVKLDSLIRDGDIKQNVDMQPGDILIIPQRYF
jgi:polysaccharide export outer membrane protein